MSWLVGGLLHASLVRRRRVELAGWFLCRRGRCAGPSTMTSRFLAVALGIVVALIVVAGALYQRLVPGLSSARPEPGPVETEVATWLLHRSVPAEAKARTNPLANDPAEIAAGHDLFSQKCEFVPRLRRRWKDRDRFGPISASAGAAIDGRVVDVGRRDFLSH